MNSRKHRSARLPLLAAALPLLAIAILSAPRPVFAGPATQPAGDTKATSDQPTMLVIVVSGTGIDEASALKQALSNAVQQAVGTIVDAETVVKNDKIIREQILTASNAIVTKYDPVGDPPVRPDAGGPHGDRAGRSTTAGWCGPRR